MHSNIKPADVRKVAPHGAAKRKIGRPEGSRNKRAREEVLADRADKPNADWLSAREVATRYGVYPGTVRAWVRKGMLPEPYLIAENSVRWKRIELDELDAKRKPLPYGRHKS